ncbi:MAG: RNA polymerase sigma factor [Gammaproteobacteria bacterium]
MKGKSGNVLHTDFGIAKAILRGDEAAFRKLFDEYFPRLFRFALARCDGNHDAAQEAVQHTFCKAIERLDSYRGEAALYAWFCQICRNTIIDSARSRIRVGPHITLLEEDGEVRAILDTLRAPNQTQPEQLAARADIVRLIQATMDNLPERYGDVLEWKYIDGRSVKEIAQLLGVGSKAAESTITRARTAFKNAVTEIAGATDVFSTLMQTTASE